MIVDDVFFNIEIMKDVLHQVLKIDIDNEVVEANNGKEAVIKYMKIHKQYGNKCPIQLILMDCDMPIMNGFRATQYILKYANEEMFKIKERKQTEINQIDSGNEIEMKVPVIVAVTGDSNAK
jgi:CheY-like chemotaxis protein